MILFFSIFFSLYAAINYYVFIRGWQAISSFTSLKPYYIAIFLLGSTSYLITKFFTAKLSAWLYDSLLWIGSFWFAFLIYFFLSVLIIDIARLINLWLHFIPGSFYTNYELTKQVTALIVVMIVSALVIYGFINTRNLSVFTKEITIAKKKSKLNELNIVAASDFHLTPVNDGKLLKKIVSKINELKPDIILLPGDIIDDKVFILKERNICDELMNLKARLGVYACTGNHEYINGVEESVNYLKELNITTLRDSIKNINDDFYLIGREDREVDRFSSKHRLKLEEILRGANDDLPKILLDHTPFKLNETKENNIDLQLSGHTHHGQFFPGNLITKMIYEVSWGYLKKNQTHYYVSCGVGTWGPPVRIGSVSEIVNIKINFVD